MCTRKAVGKQRCAALDPSSPPAVTDQVARTSSDGFLKRWEYPHQNAGDPVAL